MEVLICKCGDCAHWEVYNKEDKTVMKCVTCQTEHAVKLTIIDTDGVKFAEHAVL